MSFLNKLVKLADPLTVANLAIWTVNRNLKL